ncbi:polysaccharide pyruvyl transferase family protein [Flavobacterium jejuense]|uniref:Polysaccharide pyruvyl transferase family protein n=1 Tax=Flavobacterium jejuense TaxID=1544455 RepID=A0ABX0ISF1_9FLAO|nr:polysaccharide pyruvyl transferase family protein [Flavobacterium jejuense]NHN26146.1 polysaccharide pyruvyl transferase family protein [Flavobacterium jejuense]
MSLKIKTITCHEVYNYGAILQEYALLNYLESKGHDVEAIHYKPEYLSGHFKLWTVTSSKFNKNIILKIIYLVLKLPFRLYKLQKKKRFDFFSEKYLKVGKQLYKDNKQLKSNLPEADAYICGSDQIWNSFFQNGKDPAFYLDFVPDSKKKISYAASFAIETLADDLKPFVKEKVERINAISVRETSGKTILADLGITNVTQVLDPVFLVDENYWKKKFVTVHEEDKYIFIYDFDNNPLIEKLAKQIAEQKDFKIYAINENISYADKNFYLQGPKTFLSLMYNAQFVITNSFHSVAFSLIFNKQFIVVNRNDAINTRMRDLLELFNLSHLLVSNDFDSRKIEMIHFEEANELRELAIKKSKEFLENALVK